MNETLLIELFLYYSQYVVKTGILPLFNKGRSDIPGYDILKNKVYDIPDNNRLSELENYVFGPNFEAVSSRVNNITGYYLFVDYGEIECSTDKSNRNTDSARLGITIAYKLKEFSGDLIEQLLVSDHTLELLVRIRNKMINDQRERYWLKDISKNHTLVPFVSKELSSTGWTILFNREAYDTFGIRTK